MLLRPWVSARLLQPQFPRRAWVLGAACSILPDADVIGFHFGVLRSELSRLHRKVYSARCEAEVVMSSAAIRSAFRNIAPGEGKALGFYFFLATASHGLLDALTDGGPGVAFFSPFDT